GRDDTDEVVLVGEYGKCQEVVVTHDLGDFFLVVGYEYGNDTSVHDVADIFVVIRDDELTEGHDPGKLSFFIDDEHIVDRLGRRCDFLQVAHRFPDGHEGRQ